MPPFTLPNAVLEPLLVPTLPVRWEIPELLTAPFEVKRTKSAAVPKLGACPKVILENDKRVNAVIPISNLFFILFFLEVNLFSLSKDGIVKDD